MVRSEFPDRRSILRSAPGLQSATTTFVRHAKRDRRGIGAHNARPQNEEVRHLKAEHHVRRRISPGNERRLAARACQRPPTSASGGVIVEEFEPPLTSVVFPRQVGYGDPARSFHESTFLAPLGSFFLMRAICNHTPRVGCSCCAITTFHPVWLPRPQALSPRWLSDCSNSRNEIETKIVELNH